MIKALFEHDSDIRVGKSYEIDGGICPLTALILQFAIVIRRSLL